MKQWDKNEIKHNVDDSSHKTYFIIFEIYLSLMFFRRILISKLNYNV